ncbi:MAG: hypothetical protein KC420_20555 [Myxococcales bacterium]|nr:hypothetical protein [Myxococcales bacterium]MCB9568007.1 hypothetical protein [Myxococcales bacterium]MCB9700451.1 hypothetical protein [Myxococcales bacterium]
MRPLRVAAVLALGLVLGCFRDRGTPPAFRFTCESDADCQALVDDEGKPVVDGDGDQYVERCISGLCQFACDGSVLDFFDSMADNGCPPDKDGYTCFNGTCNHMCDAALDPSPCSDPHRCIELSVAFGDIPGLDDILEQLPQERPGICGLLCDDAGAPACPDGQACVSGVCIGFGGGGTTGGTSGGTDTMGTTGP